MEIWYTERFHYKSVGERINNSTIGAGVTGYLYEKKIYIYIKLDSYFSMPKSKFQVDWDPKYEKESFQIFRIKQNFA